MISRDRKVPLPRYLCMAAPSETHPDTLLFVKVFFFVTLHGIGSQMNSETFLTFFLFHRWIEHPVPAEENQAKMKKAELVQHRH